MTHKDWLDSLKVGDLVTRWLGGRIPHDLTVTQRTNAVIICEDWKFHAQTGGEIDLSCHSNGLGTVISLILPLGHPSPIQKSTST
jgi:hypothetical protein